MKYGYEKKKKKKHYYIHNRIKLLLTFFFIPLFYSIKKNKYFQVRNELHSAKDTLTEEKNELFMRKKNFETHNLSENWKKKPQFVICN